MRDPGALRLELWLDFCEGRDSRRMLTRTTVQTPDPGKDRVAGLVRSHWVPLRGAPRQDEAPRGHGPEALHTGQRGHLPFAWR